MVASPHVCHGVVRGGAEMTNGVSVGRRTDERAEPVRTDMHCHECNLNFVARLDLSIDGNHTIVCPNPNCGHLHYRYVDKGVVTGEGAGALPLARRFRPDAITLDIGLPDMDGFALLDLLERRGVTTLDQLLEATRMAFELRARARDF